MSTDDFCVSRAYAQLLVNMLLQRELSIPVSARDLLQQYGEPGDAIPIGQWLRLLDDASREIPDIPIGLLVGQAIQLRHLGVLGYALMASENMGELIRRYVQYQCTFIRGFPTDLTDSGDLVTLSWPILTPFSIFQSNVCAVTALLTALREATGVLELMPAHIGFVDEKPPEIGKYQEVLGKQLSFNNAVMRFSLPTSLLDMPLIGADANLIGILHAQLEGLAPLAATDGRGEQLIVDLHRHIVDRLGRSTVSIEYIARKLGLSKRTLSRQLTEHNTNFRLEFNRVQERVAKSYLKDGRIPLAEVALLVGYEDQSSFTRAFKNWTGHTPGYWREKEMT
jgi:AraC-like DNA-binding protein